MSLPIPPKLTRDHALFLDFDGTLAPLQDDAASVSISEARHDRLLELSAQLGGALAVISGRDVRDLACRVPRGLLRIGNHGLYELTAGSALVPTMDPLPPTLLSALKTLVEARGDAFLEVKGPVGTVHFRGFPEQGPILIDGVKSATAAHAGYKTKVGNGVVEAIPVGANKGTALSRIMKTAPFKSRTPIMIGDDTTDEDAFLAAQRLGGMGVKVGDGNTAARKWLQDVDAVWQWLGTEL